MITLKIRSQYYVCKTIDIDAREWSLEIWYVLNTKYINVKPLSKTRNWRTNAIVTSLVSRYHCPSILFLLASLEQCWDDTCLSHSLLYCTFIMPLKPNSCKTAIICKIFISIQWQSKINEFWYLVSSPISDSRSLSKWTWWSNWKLNIQPLVVVLILLTLLAFLLTQFNLLKGLHISGDVIWRNNTSYRALSKFLDTKFCFSIPQWIPLQPDVIKFNEQINIPRKIV